MKLRIRRILSAVLVLAMVVGFIPALDLSVKASAAGEETPAEPTAAVYAYVADISEYRANTEAHDANNNDKYDIAAVYNNYPHKDGYVFAGWYYDEAGATPLEQSVTTGGAYAKFVPEKLMKAVAQVSTTTNYDTESSALRFVAAVDSLDYAQVGFLLNKVGSAKTYTHGATSVYKKLSAASVEGGSIKPAYFGVADGYMFALTLTGIKDQAANYVATPFWITRDGTKVDHIPTSEKAVKMGIAANVNAGLTVLPVVDTTTATTAWYDESKTEFVLSTLGEFKGFVELAKTNNFAGKTIKLATDISLNTGNATTWGTTAPANVWTPIPAFNGTFDGQGHTISGLYYKNTTGNKSVGFFSTVTNATIKNLTIDNSYLGSTAGSGNNGILVGSAAGVTVQNVKITDTVTVSGSTYTGVVAYATGANAINFKNVWLDGTVTNGMWTARIGGLLGFMANTSGLVVKVENCLFTGTVKQTHASSTAENYVGGFVGGVGSNVKINVTNSLSAGTITKTTTGSATYVGSVVGITPYGKKANAVFTNAYGTTECYSVGTYRGADQYTGTITLLAQADITGANAASVLTGLDFANTWAVRGNDVPKLILADTTWYDANKTEFVIYTAEQLYGFSILQETYDFSGKTVKLGADIVLNEGDAKTWATTAPANVWNPIGKSDASKAFLGTFDGQGHTISGLYYTSASYGGGLFVMTGMDAVIKNVKLTNSYIKSTHGAEWSATGSIVAFVNGSKFYNVYSDAIIDTNSGYTGGLLGRVQGTRIIMEGCEFAGTLTATGTVANYIGGLLGGFNTNTAYATELKNNTVSGTVVAANNYVGGIAGRSSGGGTNPSITVDGFTMTGRVQGANTCIGGLFGQAGVAPLTVKNVHISGAVVGTTGIAGGLIGQVANANVTIENSSFSGTVNGGTKLGGFVGQTATAGFTTTIKNSTFSGTVTGTNTSETAAAGFVGYVTNGNVTIQDSVSEGTLVAPGPYCAGAISYIHTTATGTIKLDGIVSTAAVQCASSNAGGLIGRLMKAGTFTISVTNNLSKATFTTNSWATSQIIANADSHAVTAYNNYFVATTNSHTNGVESGGANLTKGPKNISEAMWNYLRGLYEVGIKPDYNGFNDSGHVIMDVNDLYGFNVYNELNSGMSGKTVTLGADIVVNEGNAIEWVTKAPKYEWKPIGAILGSASFKGNFDGKGHTISGIYCAYPSGNSMGLFREVTGTVGNFKLVNSYLANTVDTTWGYNGGIVAALTGGTIYNVYSDAIVETVGAYAGGIVGNATGTATVKGCVFEGILNARCYCDGRVCDNGAGSIRAHARYVGGIVGHNGATALTINDCVSSGLVVNTDNGAHRTGGILGGSEAARVVTITGCISNGQFRTDANSYHFSMITDLRLSSGNTTLTNLTTVFSDNYILGQTLRTLTTNEYLNSGSRLAGCNNNSAGVQSTIYYTADEMTSKVGYAAMATGNLDFENIWKFNKDAMPSLQWLSGANEVSDLNFHYLTTEEGGKLLSVSMPNGTYDQFVDMEIEETDAGQGTYTDDNGDAQPYLYLTQVNDAPVEFKDIFYGYGTYLTKYTGTTLADTQALVAAMKEFGFEEYTTSTLSNGDVTYTALTFGDYVYAVTYFANTQETYISASEEQKLSPFMNETYYQTAVNTALGEPSSVYSDVEITSVALDGGGDAFVIRLKNGHYIVVDGGTSRQSDRDRVAAALGANAASDGTKKPQVVVDAWFYTHAHSDHAGMWRGGIYGALNVDVYIKGFYYNFTEKWHKDATIYVGETAYEGYRNEAYYYVDQDSNGKNYYRKGIGDTSEYFVEWTATHRTAANGNTPAWGSKGVPIYRIQAGQKFYFDGMTVEIPYTQEQVQPSEINLDLNGTCSWMLFTDDYGQTFLDAGDAERFNAEHVAELYSADYELFGADVGKTFHHGLNSLIKYTGDGTKDPAASTIGDYDYSLLAQFYGNGAAYGDGKQTQFVFITKTGSSWLQISGYNSNSGSQRDLSIHEMYYLFGYILTSKRTVLGYTYTDKIRDYDSWNYPTLDTKIPFAAYGSTFTKDNYTDTFEGTTTVTMNASGITWDKSHTFAIYD